MARRSAALNLVFSLLLAVPGAVGCRHHCGYVDVEVAYRKVEQGRPVAPASATFLVLREPDVGSPVLEVQLAQVTEVRQLEEREFSGREVHTRYHWTAPFGKLFLPFSLPMAVVMPGKQPHHHSGGSWGVGDYLRDFVGWLNPFEAYPGGRQHLGDEKVRFRRERAWAPAKAEMEGAAQVAVVVECAGQVVAAGETDAGGRFRVDLREVSFDDRATSVAFHVLTVRSPDARCRGVAKRLLLDKALVAGWLKGKGP